MGIIGDNFLEEKIKGNIVEKDFFEEDMQIKANRDFMYLASNCNFSSRIIYHATNLFTAEQKEIGTFIIVGATENDTFATCPKSAISPTLANSLTLAVVVYSKDNKVNGVYLFDISNVDKKCGIFSIYKNKGENYLVKIKGCKSKKYDKFKFGTVLKEYIK